MTIETGWVQSRYEQEINGDHFACRVWILYYRGEPFVLNFPNGYLEQVHSEHDKDAQADST